MAFPASPVEGQTFTENNTVWIYSAVMGQWNRSVINPLNETTYIGSDGAPGGVGSKTQVIFNDDGDFGADATFTFDKGTDTLSAPIVTATTLNGALGTSSQTAITAVGTLGALAVTGKYAVKQITNTFFIIIFLHRF